MKEYSHAFMHIGVEQIDNWHWKQVNLITILPYIFPF